MDAASLLFRVETLLFLLSIATVSAIVLKKINIPFTIGLVPVGIVIAALLKMLPPMQHVESLGLGRELIMYVLLPALIFDASINIDTKLLKRHLYPTLMLAGPGLAIATFITGGIVHWVAGVSWGSSMIFGALISATDPVAVISLFEIVGAPRRLRILVDGESLFNDATAIAMFNVVTKLVFGGIALSWGETA
ncbi:MAG: cation:proton antiporter, partial [Victivallaceae bacterium]|nr:cation:proton antiporter [Victivallaceae bacterium]